MQLLFLFKNANALYNLIKTIRFGVVLADCSMRRSRGDTWYHCEIVTVAVIKYSSPNLCSVQCAVYSQASLQKILLYYIL